MTVALCTELLFEPQKGKSFNVYKVSEVEIESSWKMLTDRAKITLPRNVKDFDKNKVSELFKVGDKCSLKMGYNGNLVTEFEGYISKVSANFPIVIELEDEMFRLKKIPVHYSSRKGSLKEFLNKYIKGIEVDCDANIELGSIRFVNTNLGAVLDKLQKDWSLYSFIRKSQGDNQIKLTIAKPYSEVNDNTKPFYFDLEKNCVSNNLKYLSKEDRTIKIKASAIKGIGKKDVVEFGDDNAKTTLNIKLDMSKSQMQDEVKRLYDLHKKEGYEGSFEIYGIPI
ncbi:MAG: hypothetical protein CSA38_01300 [Flavobacteriales bacterium]|nr:MAG: hypothetical protein CSA38_01300 [Flavobacteriales bacterium]